MSWRVEHADARRLLRELPDNWAQTCITSPPYWEPHDNGLAPSVKSGAWQGCLGLEPSAELYIEHLVAVLGEVRRVLREDGTLWLVLGDSYAAARGGQDVDERLRGVPASRGSICVPAPAKAKDLLGIPWQVALALRRQGWWLRCDVVWAKPNPMPENVRDRPTRAHEYLFLLAKQPRYFYDRVAIAEADTGRCSGNSYARPGRLTYRDRRGQRGQHEPYKGGRARQRRSWWKITARGYPGAQAAFPEKLIEPCVLAGSAPRACGVCGTPWKRELHATADDQWRPGCSHNDPTGRCLVLDPFCGSGSTGAVAQRLGRDFLGIELSAATAKLARRRLSAAEAEQRR